MSDYWVNFLKTGDPNGQSLPEWLPWKKGKIQFMELGDTFNLLSMSKEKADFWERYYNNKFDLD
jgi:carboxylesterase type B